MTARDLSSHTASSHERSSQTASSILSVKNATRRFGGLIAVNEVSFEVVPGEIFGLIGPNGAGKTTMFNLLSGLTPPSSGAITFEGRSLIGLPPYKIAELGVARTFQNIRLFGNLSALENVKIAQHTHTKAGVMSGVFGAGRAREEEPRVLEKATELLKLVGLNDLAGEQAKNFSYGDQRRLEIARALALDDLASFAATLQAHIQWEERVLFSYIQSQVSPDELQSLGDRLHSRRASDAARCGLPTDRHLLGRETKS